MARYKPVEINVISFVFCRYSMAVIVWLAFGLQSKMLLTLSAIIFLLSAILKVQKAPMIVISNLTLCQIRKSQKVLVNEHAMYFAHSVGFIFSVLCLVLVISFVGKGAWLFVGIFAVLKSVSALGLCPAAKLYECMFNGTCCVNSKDKKCINIR